MTNTHICSDVRKNDMIPTLWPDLFGLLWFCGNFWFARLNVQCVKKQFTQQRIFSFISPKIRVC